MWQLTSRTDVDAAGQRRIDPVLGPDPLGILCFGGNHFAAQFMKRDRSSGSAPSSSAPANNSSAVNGYDAYFGTYTLDESAGTIAVTLQGSISEKSIGSTFTRHVQIAGNQLTIWLPTVQPDATAVTRTLIFSRLS